eukprot:4261562-Prymnesium_polylepis.1
MPCQVAFAIVFIHCSKSGRTSRPLLATASSICRWVASTAALVDHSAPSPPGASGKSDSMIADAVYASSGKNSGNNDGTKAPTSARSGTRPSARTFTFISFRERTRAFSLRGPKS